MGQQNPDQTDDEDDPDSYDEQAVLGLLASSQHRQTVAGTLKQEGMLTPTQISEETDLTVTHVSRALSDMRDYGVVELCVPEDQRKGRLYRITEDGEGSLQKLQ